MKIRSFFIGEMSMDNREKTDKKWMQAALDLAGNGEGHVHPNPLVGAVIVKDGEAIGSGWHEYCGGLHAERNALKDCRERGNDPQGATIYVTLEPCQMCAGAIIQARMDRVVIGSMNPKAGCAGSVLNLLERKAFSNYGMVLKPETEGSAYPALVVDCQQASTYDGTFAGIQLSESYVRMLIQSIDEGTRILIAGEVEDLEGL